MAHYFRRQDRRKLAQMLTAFLGGTIEPLSRLVHPKSISALGRWQRSKTKRLFDSNAKNKFLFAY